MKVKLAEALLRRKELILKVEQLRLLKDKDVFYEVRSQRIKAHEGIDSIDVNFPKLEVNQVTAEFDYYSRALRLVDAAIQQTNWTAEVDVHESTMSPFTSSK